MLEDSYRISQGFLQKSYGFLQNVLRYAASFLKDSFRTPVDFYPGIAQKWLPNRAQNGSKMAPKWPPEGSWSPLGSLLAIVALISLLFLLPGGLLGRSWGGLGCS